MSKNLAGVMLLAAMAGMEGAAPQMPKVKNEYKSTLTGQQQATRKRKNKAAKAARKINRK